MTTESLAPVHLRRHGVSVVVAPDDDGVPVLLHWGADLGDPDDHALAALVRARRPGVSHSAYNRPRTTGLVPEVTRGFTGTPALEGHRVGDDTQDDGFFRDFVVAITLHFVKRKLPRCHLAI